MFERLWKNDALVAVVMFAAALAACENAGRDYDSVAGLGAAGSVAVESDAAARSDDASFAGGLNGGE